ncbi:YibE/F family protein [Cellulomonas sp. APG4]|uniref:YibE/F family protein n=1 Tax=Cellulomonas sp. APG4 TaxID=1538656 RepID=UPI0013793BA4|nr:YibE/F family protein [Cellulomonas sp. APG4]NCT92313.1 YibE/F family protein [Cellulomonas sp. APG4]
MGAHHPAVGEPHVPVRASRRARVVLTALLVPAVLAALVGGWLLLPRGEQLPSYPTTAPGAVMESVELTSVDPGAELEPQARGTAPDGSQALVHVPPEYLDELRPGDRVRAMTLPEGMSVDGATHVFVDLERGPPMLLLAVVMTVLVVAVARLRGLAALAGLVISLATIGAFTLPALLAGRPALLVAVVSAVAIMTAVLYLAHGPSARTSTALLGTLVGVLLAAGVSAWAVGAARLTGLSGEVSLDLLQLAPGMSLSGVLLCGFVLASLGVLNDVTITQASAVWELRAASPAASRRSVFASAMRIGRDHIASTVYTVAFAYVGAALPLVLMVAMSDRALLDVLTSGEVAEEVVRTLVGTIGLVLAIPVTTGIAALVAGPRALAATEPAADDVVPVTSGA